MERFDEIYAISKPPLVRVLLLFWLIFTGYDVISGQLELPTVRKLWGMSGSLLPWWGWLLILQAIFVYALFEYVRRNVRVGDVLEGNDDSEIRQKFEDINGQISALHQQLTLEMSGYQNIPENEIDAKITLAIDELYIRLWPHIDKSLSYVKKKIADEKRVEYRKQKDIAIKMLQCRSQQIMKYTGPDPDDDAFTQQITVEHFQRVDGEIYDAIEILRNIAEVRGKWLPDDISGTPTEKASRNLKAAQKAVAEADSAIGRAIS